MRRVLLAERLGGILLLSLLSLPADAISPSTTIAPNIPKCDYTGEQTVAKCLQPMLQYAKELQEQSGTIQFPLHGGSIFHKLCSLYHQFMECVEEVECSSVSVEAVVASYGFMCGSGMELFEKHASCFARVETEPAYLKCKEAATVSMNDAFTMHKKAIADGYLRVMCSAMEDYLRCSHPIILSHCGGEAWELVSTVTRDSLHVTMPNCDLHQTLF